MTGSSTQFEAVDHPRPIVVALTGFMGSGKTTIGRELAVLLGWPLVDLDVMIEARKGQTIREIFRSNGESAFRALEHAALQAFLSENCVPAVLAMGGGAFVQAENAALLQQHCVVTVFLEVPVEELLGRCKAEQQEGGENLRPLATDEISFRELHAQRLPAYRRAEIVVDAAEKDPAAIAKKIADALREWLGE